MAAGSRGLHPSQWTGDLGRQITADYRRKHPLPRIVALRLLGATTPGSGIVLKITAFLSHSSVRTLILEIDQSGRIVQHDRGSLEILASPGESLLGAHLSDLVAGATPAGSPLKGLLDAARSGREATAVLALRTRQDDPVDAVVSIQPMRGSGDSLSALVIMRMPPPPTSSSSIPR
jgi:hypothetical protein